MLCFLSRAQARRIRATLEVLKETPLEKAITSLYVRCIRASLNTTQKDFRRVLEGSVGLHE